MSIAMSSQSGEYISAKDTLFIATECHLATMQDEDGDTPLHIAVVKGNVLQCQRLCKLFRMAKKSVDVYNKLIQTPLHIATITNKPSIIECLLEFGANPNIPDRFGYTCVHLCAKHRAAESLVKYIEKCKNHLNLKAQSYNGLTALHVAVNENVMSVFQILVANGADVDAKDAKSGRTPLIYAIEGNRMELVEKLLECDTNVSQQTFSGDTALHIASGRGLQDIVRLLLRRGADASTKNTHSDTPISLAKSNPVSIMMRSDNSKAMTFPTNVANNALSYAEAQYKSHIAKNTNLPMPPHLLTSASVTQPPISNNARMIGKQKIKEEPNDEIPAKRLMTEYKPGMRTSTSAYSQSVTSSGHILNHTPVSSHPIFHQQIPLLPPIFHIPTAPPPTQPPQQIRNIPIPANTIQSDSTSSKSHDQPKIEQTSVQNSSQKSSLSSSEQMMVVAAEEVVQSGDQTSPQKGKKEPFVKFKSEIDEQVNKVYLEQHMLGSQPPQKIIKRTTSCDAKIAERSTTTNVSIVTNTSSRSKAVVVQFAQPLVEPTALKAEVKSEFTRTASPPNYSQDDLMLPNTNDIQPDTKLFQLAKQGMAAAVMAQLNSDSLQKSFNLSLSKKGPSRQAKIKSGTLELQHLALQGLAVAAMNTKSEEDIEQDKRNHDLAGLGLPPSNVTQIPSYLSKVFNTNESVSSPGLLQRSLSMPAESNERKVKSEIDEAKLKIETDNQKSILALANATVQKQNVVQAVSAFSMPSIGLPPVPPNPLLRSNSGPSKQTKLSLRNAIMDRPITSAKAVTVENNRAYSSSTKSLIASSKPGDSESARNGSTVKIAKVSPSTAARRDSIGTNMTTNLLHHSRNVHSQAKFVSPTRSGLNQLMPAIDGSLAISNAGASIERSMPTFAASNIKNANPKALYILNHAGGVQQCGLPETVSSVLPIQESVNQASILQKQLQNQLQTPAALTPHYMQQVIYMPYGRQQYVPYVVPVTVPDSNSISIQHLPIQQYQSLLQSIPATHVLRTTQSSVIQSVKDVINNQKTKAETNVTCTSNFTLSNSANSTSTLVGQTPKQKPIAAVTPQKAEEIEEQPLNLSKKQNIQPLNLITNEAPSVSSENNQTMRRPSVIREIPSSESTTTTIAPTLVGIESQPRILASQLHSASLLPPPIILPQQLQQGNIASHSLASYSYLPPIHYVPGMPFICPTATTYANQPKKD